MLQLSQERNIYKKKIIYTLIAIILLKKTSYIKIKIDIKI